MRGINLSENILVCSNLVSSGRNLESWIDHFQGKGITVAKHFTEILRSITFQATNGATYETALLKGAMFNNDLRFYDTIKKESVNHNLLTAGVEEFFLTVNEFSKDRLIQNGMNAIILINRFVVNDEALVLCYNGDELYYWPVPSTVDQFFRWSDQGRSFLFLKSFNS